MNRTSRLFGMLYALKGALLRSYELKAFLGKKMIEIKSSFPKQNKFNDDDLVCYCFKHTKKDIENDLIENGRSLIYEKIVLEKKAGGCNCASTNPSVK